MMMGCGSSRKKNFNRAATVWILGAGVRDSKSTDPSGNKSALL